MMECKSVVDSGGRSNSSSNSSSSMQQCGVSSVCEEEEPGWLTSTPQLSRRQPLHHLNTASPRPPPPPPPQHHTPYRYHGCKSIPEEREDQENIDPCRQAIQDSGCSSVKQSSVSPGTNTSHTDSSPFAYPLIWEGSRTSITTPTTTSPSSYKSSRPPVDCMAWRSPISNHRDHHLPPSSKEDQDASGKESQEGSVKVRTRSGSSNDGSGSKGVCAGPSVTPSKTNHSSSHVLTHSSVFLTPSSSMQCTRSCENRLVQTPQQHHRPALCSTTNTTSSHHLVNPFEVGAESLYMSAVSPSLFQQVVSPSQKEDVNFRWSIDQMAALQPVNIETSPFTQMEGFVDPDDERRAQDAIDRFFTSHHSVIPSPWTGSNKSISVIKKMCVQQSQASPSVPTVPTQSVWCQTELTLPPILPPALEEALKPFCTFTQNQSCQQQSSGDGDEAGNLNNTTLRRKLLFHHEDQPSNAQSPRKAGCDDVGENGDDAAAGDDDDDEEEESRLVWCTAVVGMSDDTAHTTSIMRHSPPTPPTTNTTTTTPPNKPLNKQPLLSPDVSPIHNHNHHNDITNTFITSETLPFAPTCFSNHNQSTDNNEWKSSGESCGHYIDVDSIRTQEEEEEDCISKDMKPLSTWSHTPDKNMKALSSTTSSPAAELRTSSNSGHFSSSPIKDLCHSPLEVDSPARRFSASPPLSPILCRSVMFPSTHPSTRLHLQQTKERRVAMEININEGSDIGFIPTTTTTITTITTNTLPHSSSLYDMEMDSQPSVESNLGEDMSSQDTGYQTVNSLSSNNYSCITYGQDSTTHLPPIQDHSATTTITTTTTTTTSSKHLPSIHLNKDFRL